MTPIHTEWMEGGRGYGRMEDTAFCLVWHYLDLKFMYSGRMAVEIKETHFFPSNLYINGLDLSCLECLLKIRCLRTCKPLPLLLTQTPTDLISFFHFSELTCDLWPEYINWFTFASVMDWSTVMWPFYLSSMGLPPWCPTYSRDCPGDDNVILSVTYTSIQHRKLFQH